MWQNISKNKTFLAILSGTLVFLSFETFNIVPLIFLFPIFLNFLTFRCRNFKSGFLYGFLASFIVMLGGFYWVIYVLKEFGDMPWAAATLLYLGFCGFGALNFPLFVGIAASLQRRFEWEDMSEWIVGLWFALGLPALFTIIEFAIPKLFPWYIGHCLYKQIWLIQIAEITGTTFLTFCVYCTGSVLGLLLLPPFSIKKPAWIVSIPIALWIFCIGFSLQRLNAPPNDGRLFKVALVQANIGSLEKMESEMGLGHRIRTVIDRYIHLTEAALRANPKPDLILWPETAMPFQVLMPDKYGAEVRSLVHQWGVTLITGGYAVSMKDYRRDSNTAFLLEPEKDGTLKIDTYNKNILLAFGEYLPLGEWFPSLYKQFPQVADFERGTEQNPFTLKDGTKLGVTICYEAIVPSFFRKTASHNVHAVVNLTNDSWFGPTSEPYLHGSLTIFRAIESRVPLFRVTNTGASFAVDDRGRMSPMTKTFKPEVLRADLLLPKVPPKTIYIQYGDWFIILAGVLFLLTLSLLIKKNASVHS